MRRRPAATRPAAKPEIARVRGACLRDHGGAGPPVVLVPSLINPPRILDLDEDVSLPAAIARMGRRSLLLDWGRSDERAELTVAGHIEQLLLPLLRGLGEPAALVGYCLGGTMAIAAANLAPCERLATLAAPWNFALYPDASKQRAAGHVAPFGSGREKPRRACRWKCSRRPSGRSIPARTVKKFAEFGRLDPASDDARRFVELEEWANRRRGPALPGRQGADRGAVRRGPARIAGSGASAAESMTDEVAAPLST